MQQPTSLIAFVVFGILYVWRLNSPVVSGAATLAYRTDQILVQPKAGTRRAALTAFHAAHGAGVRRTFGAMVGLQVITSPAGETVPSLVAKYQQRGRVNLPSRIISSKWIRPCQTTLNFWTGRCGA